MEDMDSAKTRSEVSLARLARTIRRWRKPFFIFALGLPVVVAVIMLFTPNKFTANGVILVETPEGQMAADMLGQFRMFTGLSAGAPPTEMYLAILRSERVGAAVAESLGLDVHYGIEGETRDQTIEMTLSQMRENIAFDTPDMVSIVIAATDTDPEMAAEIINAYLNELEVASQTLALSRARRTRQLVAEALKETEAELDSTRRRMQEFQEAHGVFSIAEQTTGTLELIGTLQTELLAAQTKRDQLEGFTSEGSAALRNLDLQIQALQTQIRQLLVGSSQVRVRKESPEAPPVPVGREGAGESFFLPLSELPRLARDYARVFTDVGVQEAKYEVLATQLEQIKIEESQSIPSFEILDRGRRPYQKSGPQRKMTVLAALVGGIMGGVLLCVLLDDLSTRVDATTRRELAGVLPDFLRNRLRRWIP